MSCIGRWDSLPLSHQEALLFFFSKLKIIAILLAFGLLDKKEGQVWLLMALWGILLGSQLRFQVCWSLASLRYNCRPQQVQEASG